MADKVRSPAQVVIPGYESAKPRLFSIRIVDATRTKYQLSRIWRVDLFDKHGLMDLLKRHVGGDEAGGFDLDKCNYAVAVKEDAPSTVKTIVHRAYNVSGLPWVGSDFEWHTAEGRVSNVSSISDARRQARVQENIERIMEESVSSSINDTPYKVYPRYILDPVHE